MTKSEVCFVYVIVVGCGRLGSVVAQDLADAGNDVCVVDRDSGKLAKLGSGFNGQRVGGIEYDSENLLTAGIRQADVLLAVTPDDNVNITVALVASNIYHVPKIIARANDPTRKYIYDTLQIDMINPTQLSARILEDKLLPSGAEFLMELGGDYDLFEFRMDRIRRCSVDSLEKSHKCRVVMVKRCGETLIANQKMTLEPGDIAICVLSRQEKEIVSRSFSKEALIWHPL